MLEYSFKKKKKKHTVYHIQREKNHTYLSLKFQISFQEPNKYETHTVYQIADPKGQEDKDGFSRNPSLSELPVFGNLWDLHGHFKLQVTRSLQGKYGVAGLAEGVLERAQTLAILSVEEDQAALCEVQ